MKRFCTILLTICFLSSSANIVFCASSENALGNNNDFSEFEIGLGESAHGFTYTKKGVLLYRGKQFSPAITVEASYFPSFRISMSKSKKLGAAIGLESANKSVLFLIDISTRSAREIAEGNTAYKAYWSPSGAYLVVLCAYEGERFINMNLKNGKILTSDFLHPPGSSNMWRMTAEPQWIGKTDRLRTTVKEICNYYDDTKCDGDKILNVQTIAIDAATLQVSKIGKVGKTSK